jgi:hypothetical protein
MCHSKPTDTVARRRLGAWTDTDCATISRANQLILLVFQPGASEAQLGRVAPAAHTHYRLGKPFHLRAP